MANTQDGEKHEEKGKFYILDKKTQIGVLGLFVKTNEKQVISGWDSPPSGWWFFFNAIQWTVNDPYRPILGVRMDTILYM